MRNNPLIFCVSRVVKPDRKEIAIRGGLSRYCNKEWIIVRPLCCFNSFYEGVVRAAYLSTSSKIAKRGDRPCAVPLSADIALYATLQIKPINIFWLGTIRTIFDSSGDNLIIFSASLKTKLA